MKRMRKVVSTLLLVCVLASMLAVSASADGLIKFTTPGQGSVTIDEGSSYVLTVNPFGIDWTAHCFYWLIDGQYVDSSCNVITDPMTNINNPTLTFNKPAGTYTVSVEVARMADSIVVDKATTTVYVNAATPDPQYITFAQDFVELDYYGDWGPNAYTVYPSGSSQRVTWGTDDPNVAVVDSSTGIVHAVGSGTTNIFAKSVENDKVVGVFQVHVNIPAVAIILDTSYLDLEVGGGDKTIGYEVRNAATQPQLTWRSSNNAVAKVSDGGSNIAYITPVGAGTATITASTTDGSAISNECLVTVSDGAKRTITVTPVNVDLVIGQSKTLTATISDDGTYIDHWYCSSPSVSLQTSNNTCTVKGVSPTGSPVKVIAYGHDGTQGYALVNVTKAEALDLMASTSSVTKGKTTTVSVVNPIAGETFSWSYSPVDIGLVASAVARDNSYVLTAGDLDGAVTVTCTSNNDSTRTASLVVGVNGVDPYGTASITPKSVNWTRGSGDLSFQVSPAAYWTYLDNQFLNTKSTSLAQYWNGTLTLKAEFLNTLSNGTHTLKVYTAYDEFNNPTGLVYATIYVSGNGTGTAGATYGDNAHVKGSASNLYFNSGNPVSDVYISGKLIGPENYSLSTDGKTLTLNSAFLNQLAYGSYTMQLNGTNGTTQTTNFRIVTANYAPSTGDNNNIGLWIAIMLLSGTGAIALIPMKKKISE